MGIVGNCEMFLDVSQKIFSGGGDDLYRFFFNVSDHSRRACDSWMANPTGALNGRQCGHFVCFHLSPAGNVIVGYWAVTGHDVESRAFVCYPRGHYVDVQLRRWPHSNHRWFSSRTVITRVGVAVCPSPPPLPPPPLPPPPPPPPPPRPPLLLFLLPLPQPARFNWSECKSRQGQVQLILSVPYIQIIVVWFGRVGGNPVVTFNRLLIGPSALILLIFDYESWQVRSEVATVAFHIHLLMNFYFIESREIEKEIRCHWFLRFRYSSTYDMWAKGARFAFV